MVRRCRISAFVVWTMLSLASCTSTIHEYPHPVSDEIEVRVVLNTDGVSNVTCNSYNETLPKPPMTSEMLRVLFYAPESGRLVAQCFLSQKTLTSEGYEMLCGRTHLPPGDYLMLAYNFDTEKIRVEHENTLSEINAFTPEIPDYLYELLHDSSIGKVFQQPEHLLVARQAIRIAESDRLQVVEAEARTVVDTYYLQVRVRGLQYASKVKATISGLSASTRFGLDERSDADSKIMFDLSGGTDPRIEGEHQDVLCALFNTFGKIEIAAGELTVRFDLLTHDNMQYVKTLDIAPIFLTEDARERHWLLIDYVLELPEPDGTGGGFDPGTTDWDEIQDWIDL